MDNNIATIDGLAQVQAKQITGMTTDKKAAQETAIEAALSVIEPTKSYALSAENNTLLETVNYSASDLRRLRDSNFTNPLIVVRDTVQSNLAALEDFGVTTDMITALTTAIASYTPWVGAPRSAASVKAAATKALVTEFKKQDVILKRIDGLVETKKNTNADFYNAYQTARVIVDNTGKKKKEEPEE